MAKPIKVRIEKRRVVEPPDFPEETEGWFTPTRAAASPGEAVEPIVVPDPTPEALEAFRRSAGAWKDLLPEDFLETIKRRRAVSRQPLDV